MSLPTSFLRDVKSVAPTACLPFKDSRVERRSLSSTDQRLITAIRRRLPPASSPELNSLDNRIVQAITKEGACFSYPVQDTMVTETLASFCHFFFSSFPASQYREVHSYLMGRIVDLTFCSAEVVPHSGFLKQFRYEVVKKVQDCIFEKIGELTKALAKIEGEYGTCSLGSLREEIQFIKARSQSLWGQLSSLGSRPLLCIEDVGFVKQALLLTEERQQRELYHAHALQQCRTKQEELRHIIALGDLYLEKAGIQKDKQAAVQAAGLYNYGLHLAEKTVDEDLLFQRLYEAGKQLSILCNSSRGVSYPELQSFRDELRRDRKGLEVCRYKAAALVKELTPGSSPGKVRKVCGEIHGIMKVFTCGLVRQCLERLGPLPCAYAILGFGSRAREEDTSRSDLEWGILIEKEAYRPYFRDLAFLLHLKVVNLGETILPCLNIPSLRKTGFYDAQAVRGFSFDGEGGGVNEIGVATKGCKTPFGNRHTFQLIHTPQQMAAFQEEEWIEKEPQLPMELLTHSVIIEERGTPLVEEYHCALARHLAKPYKGTTLRSYLAKEHLYEGDADRFDPSLGINQQDGRLFEVKTDLYRLPHLLIERLALFFGLRSANTLDRVDELELRGILDPEAAKHLAGLVASTVRLRMQAYEFHQKQEGTINAVTGQLGFRQQEGQFVLDEAAFADLQKIYQVLLPFQEMINRFFKGEEKVFATASLWDDRPFTLARIAARLLQYPKAHRYYLQAKEEQPEDLEVLKSLGISFLQVGNPKDAIEVFHKFFQVIHKSPPVDARQAAITGLNNLACAYRQDANLKEAITHYEDVLQKVKEIHGEQSVHYAAQLSNLATVCQEDGQWECAASLFNQALAIDERAFATDTRFSLHVARDLNGLALVYQEQKKLSLALPLFERALGLQKKIYGENHPITAITLNNLAVLQKERGDVATALSLLFRVLKVHRAVYGERHPAVITDLNNLGTSYLAGRDFKRARSFLEEARQVASTYAKCLLIAASIWNNLGLLACKQEDFNSAICDYQTSLKIMKECASRGKMSPNYAGTLQNLGRACERVGAIGTAIESFKDALPVIETAYGKDHSVTQNVRDHLSVLNKKADAFVAKVVGYNKYS